MCKRTMVSVLMRLLNEVRNLAAKNTYVQANVHQGEDKSVGPGRIPLPARSNAGHNLKTFAHVQ